MSGLIMVQTVLKGYQPTALAGKELRVCLCIGVGHGNSTWNLNNLSETQK